MPVFTSPPIPTFAMMELWGSQVKRLVIEEEVTVRGDFFSTQCLFLDPHLRKTQFNRCI